MVPPVQSPAPHRPESNRTRSSTGWSWPHLVKSPGKHSLPVTAGPKSGCPPILSRDGKNPKAKSAIIKKSPSQHSLAASLVQPSGQAPEFSSTPLPTEEPQSSTSPPLQRSPTQYPLPLSPMSMSTSSLELSHRMVGAFQSTAEGTNSEEEPEIAYLPPQSTVQQATKSEFKDPEVTDPDEPYLAAARLELAHLEKAHPEAARPKAAHPKAAHPEAEHPEMEHPEGLNLQGTHPQGLNPQGTHPQGLNPHGTHPQGLNPHGTHPQGLNHQGTQPLGSQSDAADLEPADPRTTRPYSESKDPESETSIPKPETPISDNTDREATSPKAVSLDSEGSGPPSFEAVGEDVPVSHATDSESKDSEVPNSNAKSLGVGRTGTGFGTSSGEAMDLGAVNRQVTGQGAMSREPASSRAASRQSTGLGVMKPQCTDPAAPSRHGTDFGVMSRQGTELGAINRQGGGLESIIRQLTGPGYINRQAAGPGSISRQPTGPQATGRRDSNLGAISRRPTGPEIPRHEPIESQGLDRRPTEFQPLDPEKSVRQPTDPGALSHETIPRQPTGSEAIRVEPMDPEAPGVEAPDLPVMDRRPTDIEAMSDNTTNPRVPGRETTVPVQEMRQPFEVTDQADTEIFPNSPDESDKYRTRDFPPLEDSDTSSNQEGDPLERTNRLVERPAYGEEYLSKEQAFSVASTAGSEDFSLSTINEEAPLSRQAQGSRLSSWISRFPTRSSTDKASHPSLVEQIPDPETFIKNIISHPVGARVQPTSIPKTLPPPHIVVQRATDESGNGVEEPGAPNIIDELRAKRTPTAPASPVPRFLEDIATVDSTATKRRLSNENATNPSDTAIMPRLSNEAESTPSMPKLKRRKLYLRKARNMAMRKTMLEIMLGRQLAGETKPALRKLAKGEILIGTDHVS
ncbi:Activating transcription factor 7-interacting protein 1 [Toensbergia leucococca]|nr:Activating transcription factor 7-interacting protein 1 [Toensbergia leucococca]